MNPTNRLAILACTVALGFAMLPNPSFASSYDDESTPLARLVPSEPVDGMGFGESAAVSGDYAAVGALHAPNGVGEVYVFRREGESWTELTKIVPSDGAPGDAFGTTLVLDGDHLMVGAPGVDVDSIEDAGAVYMFQRVGDTWIEVARLTNDSPYQENEFGSSTALHGDTAAIGTGGDPSARVLLYSFDGTTWVQDGSLFPDNSGSELFGIRLEMSERWLLVMEYTAPVDERLRVYERVESSWVFRQAVGGDPQRSLFTSMGISADRIAAAAFTVAGDTNLVYLYEYDGNQWNRQTVLEGPPDDGFARTLALTDDLLLVGARESPNGRDAGQAFLYTPVGSQWVIDSVMQREPVAGERPSLGTSADVDGRHAIVGAPEAWLAPDEEISCGAAYIAHAIPCRTGIVDAGAGLPENVLFLNGLVGALDRTVEVEPGDAIIGGILDAPEGGSRFVVHANGGLPTRDTLSVLPAQVGLGCFPFLTTDGADPLAVWNNIGRDGKLGASRDFAGQPIANPALAPTLFLVLHEGDPVHLPVGTTVTFQGILLDGGSPSRRGVSVTNAVILRIL